MINKLKQRKPVEVFHNLYWCPLSRESVLQAVKHVIDEGDSQIYQISGDKDLSYEELLRLIADNNGCDQSLIIPASCQGNIYSEHILRYTSLKISNIFKDSVIFDLNHQNIIRQIYG